MVRCLLPLSVLILMAGCQSNPAAPDPVVDKTDPASISGIWTVNSKGYQDGVYKQPGMIVTACTEYKDDGTYETTQQYVSKNLNHIYTEIGTWSYNGSFLTMQPTKKSRKLLHGKFEGAYKEEPKVTGQKFELEIVSITKEKMIRKSGGEQHEFLRSLKPQIFSEKDLPPAQAPLKPTTSA